MALKLITAPTTTPISLAEVRSHMKIDSAAENVRLERLINAVTGLFDGEYGLLGRALVSQTWDLYLDTFPASEIEIPLPPLISITSVKYDDVSGVEQTVSSANYYVDTVSQPGWIVPVSSFSWPSTLDAINAVRVRFVAGYSTVPETLKLGLLNTVQLMFENAGITQADIVGDPQVAQLLATYRASWF